MGDSIPTKDADTVPVEFRSPLAAFMAGTQQGIDADEFTHYLEAPPLKFIEWKDDDHNIFHWWKNSGYDTLCQMAFDVLSIPTTSKRWNEHSLPPKGRLPLIATV